MFQFLLRICLVSFSSLFLGFTPALCQEALSVKELYDKALLTWRQGFYRDSAQLWQLLINEVNYSDNVLKSRAFINLTQVYLDLGAINEAKSTLTKAAALASEEPHLTKFIIQLESNLAIAQQNWTQAIFLLESLVKLNPSANNTNNFVNLSFAYEKLGLKQEQLAQNSLLEGNEVAYEEKKALARDALEKSVFFAQEAVNLVPNEISLSAARAWIRLKGYTQAMDILSSLPESRQKTQLLLEIAEQGFIRALNLAKISIDSLNNPSIKAQVFLSEAKLRLKQGKEDHALDLAWKGYFLVGEGTELEQYQFQWLLARIFRVTNQIQQSQKFYLQAIHTAEKIRQKRTSSSHSLQLSFQEESEPLYREALEMILNNASTPDSFQAAIDLIKQFHLAELETFFASLCDIEIEVEDILKHDEARIYTFILSDSLYQIVRFSNNIYQSRRIPITKEEITSLVRDWRRELETSSNFDFRDKSALFYDWLIRPWNFSKRGIKYLSFVNDDILRSIPMTVMWDKEEEKYAIENFVISHSLGLKVTKAQKSRITPAIFANSEISEAFPEPLPHVPFEAKQIQELVGGEVYLNEEFTQEQLNRVLDSPKYTVIHIASHARFSSLEDSYLQLGDGLLSLISLEKQLRSRKAPLELLVLSACQTAAGNNKAILGLAGVGIRSGIPSVLGALWFADDEIASALMSNFYQYWQSENNVAQALRLAQLEAIASPLDDHPRFWATFILLIS